MTRGREGLNGGYMVLYWNFIGDLPRRVSLATTYCYGDVHLTSAVVVGYGCVV